MTLRENIRRALLTPCEAGRFPQSVMRQTKTQVLKFRALPGSLRWAASNLGVTHSHLSRVLRGADGRVSENLLARYNQLKGTR